MLGWAREGTCVLINVELDSPTPDEPPRVTVRGARPLAEVKSASSMSLTLDILQAEALTDLAAMLPTGAEGRGEVVARLRSLGGRDIHMRLGQDFQLDGELAERLASIEGVANVSLSARRGAGHLKLVA
jgi:DNA polymerase III subunit alpha